MTHQELADELISKFLPLVRAKMGEDYQSVYRRARLCAFEHVQLLQAEMKKIGVRTPHWTKVRKELE